MNGVEILVQETIYETAFPWWLILIFAGGGLIVGIIITIIHYIDYGFFDPADLVIIFLCVITGVWFGALGALMSEDETDTIDHVEYKVTIDDSVSMNEFLDKYEIIDQEGKIYTVKEKE
jgi:uncharacterized protein YacL